MMNAIVCVGVGHWYPRGVKRLKDSLDGTNSVLHGSWVNDTNRLLMWPDEYPAGSPSHQENPYAFKIYAIEQAFELGYDNVLWLDASFWAIKDPSPIFDIIRKDGYFLWDSGWNCAQWTNDNCLEVFGTSRDEAEKIPMISSGIVGVNAKSSDGIGMFTCWKHSMYQGAFRGSHTRRSGDKEDERYMGHRHDQSAASLSAYQTKCLTLQGNDLVNYDRGDTRDTVCLVCRGL